MGYGVGSDDHPKELIRHGEKESGYYGVGGDGGGGGCRSFKYSP